MEAGPPGSYLGFRSRTKSPEEKWNKEKELSGALGNNPLSEIKQKQKPRF